MVFFYTHVILSPQLRVTSRDTQKHSEAIKRCKHIPYNFDSRRSVKYKCNNLKMPKMWRHSHVNVLAFWDCLELKCIKLELINVLFIKSSKKSYLMQKKNGHN